MKLECGHEAKSTEYRWYVHKGEWPGPDTPGALLSLCDECEKAARKIDIEHISCSIRNTPEEVIKIKEARNRIKAWLESECIWALFPENGLVQQVRNILRDDDIEVDLTIGVWREMRHRLIMHVEVGEMERRLQKELADVGMPIMLTAEWDYDAYHVSHSSETIGWVIK